MSSINILMNQSHKLYLCSLLYIIVTRYITIKYNTSSYIQGKNITGFVEDSRMRRIHPKFKIAK